MFDGDRSGYLSAKKFQKQYRKKLDVSVVPVPDGIDPNDMSYKEIQKLRTMKYE